MNNKSKRKLFNVRLPVLLAIALAVGIAVGCLFIYYNISLFWIIAVIPVAAVIFILFAVSPNNIFRLVTVVSCSLLIILGAVNCYLLLDNYTVNVADGNTYSVSATVGEKVSTETEEFIILDKVYLNGRRVHGKIKVYLGTEYGEFCDAGYTVSFESAIHINDPFLYGRINYLATENIRYTCSVYGGLKSQYGFSMSASVRTAIRKVLYGNLDADTAAVTLAMLTGNTYGIEDGTLENFRYGGVAHIFAVSGLHIGIVFGIFSLIFRKFKINKYLSALFCFLPVILYAGVCGFTLSSIRAAVMCCVSVLCRLFNKKYDGLNSLSLAVILILLINPINLFSVGFRLSVCAVAGINLLSKNIARHFKKLPRAIGEAAAVSLSAQAGTLPVMLASFGYLSGAGLLLNIVLIPLLSVLFVLMLVSVLLALIFPFASAILIYAALPLEAVVSILVGAGFEKALIRGLGAGLFIPLYYLAIALLSDKINLKSVYRISSVFLSLIILISYTLVKTYYPFSGYKVIVSAYYGGGQVVIKSKYGNVLIVTEHLKTSHTDITLNEYYASSLSAVIILGGEDCALSYDQTLDCKDIYVFYRYLNLQPYNGTAVHYEESFTVCGVDFEFYDGYNITADCGGVTVGICASGYVPFKNCNLLVTDYTDNKCAYDYAVSFNNRNIYDNVYERGDFCFYLHKNVIRRAF